MIFLHSAFAILQLSDLVYSLYPGLQQSPLLQQFHLVLLRLRRSLHSITIILYRILPLPMAAAISFYADCFRRRPDSLSVVPADNG